MIRAFGPGERLESDLSAIRYPVPNGWIYTILFGSHYSTNFVPDPVASEYVCLVSPYGAGVKYVLPEHVTALLMDGWTKYES